MYKSELKPIGEVKLFGKMDNKNGTEISEDFFPYDT